MIKPSRRNIVLGGLAALAAGAGVYGLFGGKADIPSVANLVTPAHGATEDLSTLNDAPPLGEMAIGKADAPVTIIEYASATCPHCAAFHELTFPGLKSDYIDTGKVRFIFREFPLDDLALAAFMVARCAPADKYFPMIDVLFKQQRNWANKNAKEELGKIAKLAGFTDESYEQCLKNNEIAKGVIDTRAVAAEKYNVSSTPYFFINGKHFDGEYSPEGFAKAISDEMKAQ